MIVTYSFTPQSGQWNAADTGLWSVNIGENSVADYMSQPLYVDSGIIGTFSVTSNVNIKMCIFQICNINNTTIVGGCCNDNVCIEAGDESSCMASDDHYLGDGIDCSLGCRKLFFSPLFHFFWSNHCCCVAIQCYIISESDRVDGLSSCRQGYDNNCDDSIEPGFKWNDTLGETAVVERVTLTFQTGRNCIDSTTRTGALNDGTELTYDSTRHCSCFAPSDTPTFLILPNDDYIEAGENTFVSTNPTDCLGFANLQSGNAVGNWAEVCVYATGE
jgi:hypothetical protein